ncbi:NAD-dependent epimerase/dehydratase family protein [Candidatus Falkowbacteria bacterium]|jgi:UDP-glucuronate decarboxylase|nr:GDP-mannose 4,6-dehydratase [Patescibacteria group bacterium]NCU43071.1 NAD-dependent epimerase/dehydratase family protein [Candidatus Falkowbacteria bacterium]
MAKKVIFDKKNVLVAGGAGFIGSHLCDELIKTCKVICVDNFITGQQKNIDHLLANPDFIFINHDLTQPLNLAEIKILERFKIKFQGIQEIYNLACPLSPKHFVKNLLEIIKANSLVVYNLLELAVQNQAKFIQFSSSVVYGGRDINNIGKKAKEEDLGIINQLSPRAAYDEGKRFAETMVNSYREAHNLDTKIIRFFRIYGPRMTLDDDQLIPDLVYSAIKNKPLVIFGNEKFSSSFCYVDDAIDGVIKMANSNLAGPINIGSDVDVNVTELAQMIIKETESESPIVYSEDRLFLTELLLPDIYQARNVLGWMPVVTLENGIKKTIISLQSASRAQGFEG